MIAMGEKEIKMRCLEASVKLMQVMDVEKIIETAKAFEEYVKGDFSLTTKQKQLKSVESIRIV